MLNIRVNNSDTVTAQLSTQNILVSVAPGLASEVSTGSRGQLSSVYGSNAYYATIRIRVHIALTKTTDQELPCSSAVIYAWIICSLWPDISKPDYLMFECSLNELYHGGSKCPIESTTSDASVTAKAQCQWRSPGVTHFQ